MPGSSSKGKVNILEWRRSLPAFKYVLDVGPGWGSYSKLLKRKGEIWHAVEIHEPYIDQFKLNNFYDKIYIKDILNFIPKKEEVPFYDLVILGDVIEHLTKQNGIETLKKVFRYSKYCLISLPLDEETSQTDNDQENSFDYWKNPHERHLARWSNSAFIKTIQDLNGEVIALAKYYELAVYLISCKNSDNFLTEPISSLDYLRKNKIILDPREENIKKYTKKEILQKIKYLVPPFIKKPIKSLINRMGSKN